MGAADYDDFIKRKVVIAREDGLQLDVADINPILKDHQKLIVQWMVRGGRRACFASFGLGKTMIQLEAVRLTRQAAGGLGLIVIPLGVRQEFTRDAAVLGIRTKFIRRIEEVEDDETIYLTNYETIRDGKLDPQVFTVASLDEASKQQVVARLQALHQAGAGFFGHGMHAVHAVAGIQKRVQHLPDDAVVLCQRIQGWGNGAAVGVHQNG